MKRKGAPSIPSLPSLPEREKKTRSLPQLRPRTRYDIDFRACTPQANRKCNPNEICGTTNLCIPCNETSLPDLLHHVLENNPLFTNTTLPPLPPPPENIQQRLKTIQMFD